MSRLASMAKKGLLKPDKAGARLGNLFTGQTINSGWMGAAVAGAGMITVGSMVAASTGARADGNDAKSLSMLSTTRKIGSTAPPAMAQGVAPSIMAGAREGAGAADNLGATGDMVFGMHNSR